MVLNDLRKSALAFIATAEGDDDLGIFEWSAPEGADPEDLAALAMANPNLGYRKDAKKLLANARRAKERGGAALASFRTNHMCQWVKLDDPAIDAGAWERTAVPDAPIEGASRWAMAIDLSADGRHAAVVAACRLPGERLRVQVADSGPTAEVRKRLLATISTVKPAKFGWLPYGPTAALAADLKDRKSVRSWPPAGVEIEELTGEAAAVCMGFAQMVGEERVEHLQGDELLDDHVTGAEKLKKPNDTWIFSRKGEGYVDAAYAAAGAVHLARTLPEPIGKPRLRAVE
ncbi:terminase large subunit [Asanoa sp. WMMD1127]|uniref:terminase TerL endonuclease subunit n=1 Tax=Asanoa sp. WMMD1127 TaxID=3016107 RepID=UPI0024162F8F|nr:terminase TerL endonuclease subunit [Asanoa sp. WMMD1127]MDG4821274.1 terminase large subunit [Asanoa sp. WMMD1127]